jgi:phosphatidylserine/phosphatidylglycerophosphate/cardiolipin synthase-like enzyme
MHRQLLLIFILCIGIFRVDLAEAQKKATANVELSDAVRGALVAAPEDKEVCFSPEENCDVKLWKFMQSAQRSLDVAVFDLTHEKIAHEIAVASKRIPVRVLVDKRQSKGEHSMVSTLIKAGVSVRFGYQRGIMHNKFTLVDGKRLETGSFNYSDGATSKNNENQIYLDDPAIVKRYQARFTEIWAEGTPATLHLTSKTKTELSLKDKDTTED